MTVKAQIKDYIGSLPESKSSELQELHQFILKIMPSCKLWFLDGLVAETGRFTIIFFKN